MITGELPWMSALLSDETGAFATIILASVMLKESVFTEEREWRLVRWLSDARLRGQKNVRARGGKVFQMNGKQLGADFIYAGFREVVSPLRDLIRGVTLSPSSEGKMGEVMSMLDGYSIKYIQCSSRILKRPEQRYHLYLAENKQKDSASEN